MMLKFLNAENYLVEWRIIDASEYGMSQRRKRVFIFARKEDSKKKNLDEEIFLNREGVFARAFPIKKLSPQNIHSFRLGTQFTNNKFFLNTGVLFRGKVFTVTSIPNFNGIGKNLGDVLIKSSKIPKEYVIKKCELKKWQDLKNGKRELRTDKFGNDYVYAEGKMRFPDDTKRPSRTIVTGEGGRSVSRFKHVVRQGNVYRRLLPIELEKLSMLPNNFTKIENITDNRRAFLLGNSVITSIITRIGNKI